MLRLCDSFRLFLASLLRFMLSVQGFLLRFTNVPRVVYPAAAWRWRRTRFPHYRQRTTGCLHSRWMDHRRWAARFLYDRSGTAAAIMLVLVLGLQCRNAESRQGDCKHDC